MDKQYEKVSETEFKIVTTEVREEVISVEELKRNRASYEQEIIYITADRLARIAEIDAQLAKAEEVGIKIINQKI